MEIKAPSTLALGALACLLTLAPPVYGEDSFGQVAPPDKSRLVAFFLEPGGSCPENWSEVTQGRGRLILGTTDPARVGEQFGTPFRPAEKRTHRHGWGVWVSGVQTTSMRLTYENGPGPWISKAVRWGDDHTIVTRGPSEESDYGYPFYQLVLCEQKADDGVIDTLPVDTVAFFNGKSCPVRAEERFKWEPYQKGNGRFIVPLVSAGTHERTVNDAWIGSANTQHRGHLEHTAKIASGGIYGDDRGCGIWCGSTTWLAGNSSTSFLTRTSRYFTPPENASFPWLELMICRKVGTGRKIEPKQDPLMTFFRAAGDCADRFRVPGSGGRFLVGLPQNGLPNQAYGGEPLMDGENRTHSHRLKFTLDTQWVYAGKGDKPLHILADQPWEAETGPNDVGLPYIQLAHCWNKPEKVAGESFENQ